MTKKTIIISSVVLLTIFVSSGIYSYNKNKKTKPENIPLVNQKTALPTPIYKKTSAPDPISAPQTNADVAVQQIPSDISSVEIEKIASLLPIRLNDFTTKAGIKTTINVYQTEIDEPTVLRLEIYGINYNEQSLTGPNALAFKESFLEARKYFPKDMVLKNTQIIYGNRQYIQDTATYWVNQFKLLD